MPWETTRSVTYVPIVSVTYVPDGYPLSPLSRGEGHSIALSEKRKSKARQRQPAALDCRAGLEQRPPLPCRKGHLDRLRLVAEVERHDHVAADRDRDSSTTKLRFAFGENWSKFVESLDESRIRYSEMALQQMLEVERLDGSTFLDIGSGSGLSSFAARRLGARVHSFDYDPISIACTREIRDRYFPNDPDWVVEQGSVLDRDYLNSLGTFDVVYSCPSSHRADVGSDR